MGNQRPTTAPESNRPGGLRRGWIRFLPAATALTALLLMGTPAGAQEVGSTVYVKTADAKVRSGTEATASVINTPSKGAALTVTEKAGTRLKVKLPSGVEGYISRLLVSDTAPDEGGGLLSELGSSTITANEAENVKSIRGLSTMASDLAKREGMRDECVKYAEKMEKESENITPAQVTTFLQSGGVGL